MADAFDIVDLPDFKEVDVSAIGIERLAKVRMVKPDAGGPAVLQFVDDEEGVTLVAELSDDVDEAEREFRKILSFVDTAMTESGERPDMEEMVTLVQSRIKASSEGMESDVS